MPAPFTLTRVIQFNNSDIVNPDIYRDRYVDLPLTRGSRAI
jgi:hypothetical protein